MAIYNPDGNAYSAWKERWDRIDEIKKNAADDGVDSATAEARAAWIVDRQDQAEREAAVAKKKKEVVERLLRNI